MGLTCGPWDGDPQAWDAFVRGIPGWTHFHLYGWKRVMEAALGHRCWYLAVLDDHRRLHGVLPLVEVRSRLFGHYLVSMPFVNYGGPLGSPAAVRLLADEATRLATERGADLMELRSRTQLDVGLPASKRKITVLLDLPRGKTEPLWASFDPKLRAQIRKPGKEGVVVKFGAAELEPFYQVFARHMRDLGTPVQGRSFFEAMAAAFPDDLWFGCAYFRGSPIAGGCGFRWGSEFEMSWASALYEFNRLAPNMFLYWSFIERCVESGIEVFNFGRCTPGSGTHRFKRQWGPSRDQQLWWYQHRLGGAVATPSATDPRYSWGPRLWKFLPLPIATRLGPRIVRFIP